VRTDKTPNSATGHHPFTLGFISVDATTRAKALLGTLLHFKISAAAGGPDFLL
jgi:hypothetical protein